YRTPEGPLVTRKLTTGQVLELIESKDFDLMAKASRSAKGGFRALACYREFEPGFLSRVAKTGADRKTTEFRTLYKKIDEEDRQRQQEWYRANPPQYRPFTWLVLAYWLASRSVLVLFLYLVLRWLVSGISSLF